MFHKIQKHTGWHHVPHPIIFISLPHTSFKIKWNPSIVFLVEITQTKRKKPASTCHYTTQQHILLSPGFFTTVHTNTSKLLFTQIASYSEFAASIGAIKKELFFGGGSSACQICFHTVTSWAQVLSLITENNISTLTRIWKARDVSHLRKLFIIINITKQLKKY